MDNLKKLAENDKIHEALTIQALRIVEMMRTINTDADIIQQEFIGNIGDYEKTLAKREGINILFTKAK